MIIGFLVASYALMRYHSHYLTTILLPKLILRNSLYCIVLPLVTLAANIWPLNIAFLPMVNILRHYPNPSLVNYSSLTMLNQMMEQQIMNICLIYHI